MLRYEEEEALMEIAEMVVMCGTASHSLVREKGLSFLPGKGHCDIMQAGTLKKGQPTGKDINVTIRYVADNLRNVFVLST